MPDQIECLRCHTQMERGFVADNSQGTRLQQRWAPGEPIFSFWTGLKLDRKKLLPVTTMRCPRCGALESYAQGS